MKNLKNQLQLKKRGPQKLVQAFIDESKAVELRKRLMKDRLTVKDFIESAVEVYLAD